MSTRILLLDCSSGRDGNPKGKVAHGGVGGIGNCTFMNGRIGAVHRLDMIRSKHLRRSKFHFFWVIFRVSQVFSGCFISSYFGGDLKSSPGVAIRLSSLKFLRAPLLS